MATLILPPMEIMQRAAAELARGAAGNSSRIGAINRAAFYLAIKNVDVLPAFDGFLVASATRAGVVHRVSTVDGCSCEAGAHGRACWHAATVEILQQAGKYTMPSLHTAPLHDERYARYTKALAEVNELF